MMDFEVVDLDDADHPEVGDTVPEFTRPLVNAEYWEDTALSEVYAEGPTLLVFHPMDGAFPTTYLWNEIRDRGWEDRVQVVGVSVSSPYEHGTLIDERGISSRLYSDPDASVAEAFGIAHDLDGMTGVSEPRPAVFLVDEEGVVEYAWAASEWPEFPDYDDIEAALDDR